MRETQNKFFIIINILFLFNYFNSYYLVQAKQNSIIKLFCLRTVKEEMLKAEIKYSDEIANQTCECYYEEFRQTLSHEDAKTKCKLETQDKFKP
tara:strand:+ start:1999 stop:2280 length:282 start_codon:yes stop_codon:yes gene_type:complete